MINQIPQIPIKDESNSEIRQSKDIEEGKAIVMKPQIPYVEKTRYKYVCLF